MKRMLSPRPLQAIVGLRLSINRIPRSVNDAISNPPSRVFTRYQKATPADIIQGGNYVFIQLPISSRIG